MNSINRGNPLNGKGTATIAMAPAGFVIAEALFHAHPFVGGVVGLVSGALAYRHFDEFHVGLRHVASSMLRDGERLKSTTSTLDDDDTLEKALVTKEERDIRDIPIPIGTLQNGRRFDRTMRQTKSILILGKQEGGKTNSGVHFIRHFAKNGAHFAIIDKHAKSEEDSMTAKIKPLEKRFDCEVGIDPASSMRVVSHVRAVLDNRIEGAKCSYPLFLIVDEFTAIMRQVEDGGKWQDVGRELAAVIEDINTEGRKHQIFCVCIGQIANVSRTGGSEVREMFGTRIIHQMSAKQANLVGLAEMNKQVERLQTGEAIMQTGGLEPFWIKLPYVTDEAVRKLARSLPSIERRPSVEEADREAFDGLGSERSLPGSTSGQNHSSRAQNDGNLPGSESGSEKSLPGSGREVDFTSREVDVTSMLRSIGKRVKEGESLSVIRKEYGLPESGRALQETNQALKALGEEYE